MLGTRTLAASNSPGFGAVSAAGFAGAELSF
jgi:hypothetical protein